MNGFWRCWYRFIAWCHWLPGGIPLAYGILCCVLVWFANYYAHDAWVTRVLHNMAEAGVGLYAFYWAVRGRTLLRLAQMDPPSQRRRENWIIAGCALIIAGSMV